MAISGMFQWTIAALMMTGAPAFAAAPARTPPSAPPEVMANAPPGENLLWFGTSGDQPNADAMAVFETSPDKHDIRHRTLTMYGKRDGTFVQDFSSAKLVACSRCSQFHDDPRDSNYLKFTQGHLHLEQMDGGQKPSTTCMDLVRKKDGWHVTNARREIIVAGDEKEMTEKLPLPESRLARDMDAKWSMPVFLNTILINHTKNDRFYFLHGDETVDAIAEHGTPVSRHHAANANFTAKHCLGLPESAQAVS